jgi:hypothetical protein
VQPQQPRGQADLGDADDDHQAEVDAVPAVGPGMDPTGIEAPWVIAVAGAGTGSIGLVKVAGPAGGWLEPPRLAAGVSAGSALKLTSPVSSTKVRFAGSGCATPVFSG